MENNNNRKDYSMTSMFKIKMHVIAFVLITSATVFAQVQNSLLGDLNVNGFISQGYMQSSANNFLGRTADGTFEFNEFECTICCSA